MADGIHAKTDMSSVQAGLAKLAGPLRESLARAARVALVEGEAKAITLGAAVSLYDDALKLYGSRQDFSVWYAP